MVVWGLGKLQKDPRVLDVLVGLLDDDEVVGNAVMGLGRLKREEARPHLERMLNHPESWIRKEAKKGLAKLDKAATKKSRRR